MNKYTRFFIEESRRYLDAIGEELRRLRQGCYLSDGLAEGSRMAHSIKGMALFEEQEGIASLAHVLERGLALLSRDGSRQRILEHLEEGVNLLQEMVDEVDRSGSSTVDPVPVVQAIQEQLELFGPAP